MVYCAKVSKLVNFSASVTNQLFPTTIQSNKNKELWCRVGVKSWFLTEAEKLKSPIWIQVLTRLLRTRVYFVPKATRMVFAIIRLRHFIISASTAIPPWWPLELSDESSYRQNEAHRVVEHPSITISTYSNVRFGLSETLILICEKKGHFVNYCWQHRCQHQLLQLIQSKLLIKPFTHPSPQTTTEA